MIKLGVKELVDFSAKSGDLFQDDIAGPTAKEGLDGHRLVQEARLKKQKVNEKTEVGWEAEKHLSCEFNFNDETVCLSGRIDLFFDDKERTVIEEIKTCYGAAYLIPAEKRDLHWAQAKVYAALYFKSLASNNQSKDINICLSYYDVLSKQIYQESQSISFDEAWEYCKELLNIYLEWFDLIQRKNKKVVSSCKALQFPYSEYRPGQRELAISVYRNISEQKHLLLEAPTGTGKTLSILFPAIKAIGESQVKRLLYLTTKGSAQLNVLDAIAQFESTEFLDCLVIQAKDKSCPCLSSQKELKESCQSTQGVCSRTLGFFDRLPAARRACVFNSQLNAEQLKIIADEHHLCPFALSILMAPWMTLVVCDVNYFYDPLVKLADFDRFAGDYVVMIDEVHNLPDRARSMYSGELDCALINEVMGKLKSRHHRLKKALSGLAKSIESLSIDIDRSVREDISYDESLPLEISKPFSRVMQELNENGDNGLAGGMIGDMPENFRALVKQIYRFSAIENLRTKAHRYLLRRGEDFCVLQNVCLDASNFLSVLHGRARSVIGFSATLRPFHFSLRQLGFTQTTNAIQAESTFSKEHCLALCTRYLSTQWQQREKNNRYLVELIETFVNTKLGNYIVFFPSFEYLNSVLALYSERNPEAHILVQSDQGDDESRQSFINTFKNSVEGVIGFAVVGGVFSEGVDFKGNMLIGAMIIGTGMAQPSQEQKLIAEYYDSNNLNSYEFVFQLPGFVRLMQTAGRVIRSENDRGAIVFVEPRLARSDYRRLLAGRYSLVYCDSQIEVEHALEKFWANEELK